MNDPADMEGVKMARFRKYLSISITVIELIGVFLLPKICPRTLVEDILAKYEKASKRVRLLPATALVYFILAMFIWRDPPQEEVLRIVCEGLSWTYPDFNNNILPTKGAISRARSRLGPDVLREMAEQTLKPIAPPNVKGAWYKGMRLMSIDGSCFDMPDSKENADFFGYPSSSRGDTAFPQLRLVGLVETGSHVIVSAQVRPYKISEQAMAVDLIENGKFSSEMLVLADRNFYGYKLWKKSLETGANLLWRIKTNLSLFVERRLKDNSFISIVCDSNDCNNCDPIKVRVIEYALKDNKNPEEDGEIYRLITNLMDCKNYPANELAALYHERLGIESLYDEIKTSLRANSSIIRSKIPDLVLQDIWAIIIIHFAIRQLMAESAWEQSMDPDDLSFKESVYIIRRKLPLAAAFSPDKEE
jgi:hypothetical protein